MSVIYRDLATTYTNENWFVILLSCVYFGDSVTEICHLCPLKTNNSAQLRTHTLHLPLSHIIVWWYVLHTHLVPMDSLFISSPLFSSNSVVRFVRETSDQLTFTCVLVIFRYSCHGLNNTLLVQYSSYVLNTQPKVCYS